MTDPYAVLGVPSDADGVEIHRAYRRAVRRAHPDVGGTAAEFEAVQDAYETLRDPARRRAHDAARPRPAPSPPPPPRRRPQPPTVDARDASIDDLLAESQRLENEARELAGLPRRDFGTAEPEPDDDSITAILDDAQRQIREAAAITARELARRLRRIL